MGRGRAKAKQQKVARELKYSSQSTDLDALQRELGHPGSYGGLGQPGIASNGSSAVDDTDDDNADDEFEDRWTGTSH
jgi:hypothetical protein